MIVNQYYYWVDNWFVGGDDCKSRSYFNGAPLSIDDYSNANAFDVYPNPTTGLINIKVNSILFGKASVMLFNINGKRIYNENVYIDESNNILEIDIEAKQRGMYFLKIVTIDKVATKKIIKY